ncbi:hypothetical protein [Reinekea sp. G2M2-21]|uniref:hypothetical protein n=1 Tax=Reinekea sp. G2M2-21 TaxID=2788942 RepID=UPI0018AAF8DF|nr:hypothetical protein [Reinekea sp. G2M2-21]
MNSTGWKKVDEGGVIYSIEYKADVAISRSTIIKLSEDRYLVYSPGAAILESALEIISKDSDLILLAPAKAHILGTVSWNNEFQKSAVVASETVIPRILNMTEIAEVKELSYLEEKLPRNVRIHALPACRLGEVWVSVDTDDKIYWIVCDSITNSNVNASIVAKWFWEKIYRVGPGLEVTRGFRYFGISKKDVYREWAIGKFSNGRDNVLIPCHGDIYNESNFTQRIIDLIGKRF